MSLSLEAGLLCHEHTTVQHNMSAGRGQTDADAGATHGDGGVGQMVETAAGD